MHSMFAFRPLERCCLRECSDVDYSAFVELVGASDMEGPSQFSYCNEGY